MRYPVMILFLVLAISGFAQRYKRFRPNFEWSMLLKRHPEASRRHNSELKQKVVYLQHKVVASYK